MKILRLTTTYLFVLIPLFSIAQTNPFLKKYAGAYHRLNFGEETPTATTEKIVFTVDGKWSSSGFPINEEGIPSKVAVKKFGTWTASDRLIQVTGLEKDVTIVSEFWLESDVFMGTASFLEKVFVPNPAYLAKYAGSFHWLYYGHENERSDFSETISLKADGKCTRSIPAFDDNGALTNKPILYQGTWKANDGVIRITINENGEGRMTQFLLRDGIFSDYKGNSLKKIVPPPPPGLYLTKYAGIYNILAEGEAVTSKSDKYILNANGTGTWSFYTLDGQGTLSATPTVIKGNWKASEGLIQLYFTPEGGDGDHGGEMLTDFRFKDGAFRAEGVMLKKVMPTR